MDKFEKLIKEAVEGYEAPFNPQAWDNVSRDLNDSFDQMIKESTSNYEAPYSSTAWEAVSSQLGPAYSAWKWVAGAAAVVAVIAGTSYFSENEKDEKTLSHSQHTEVAVNSDQNTTTPSHQEEDIVSSHENTETITNDNTDQNASPQEFQAIDPDNNSTLTTTSGDDEEWTLENSSTDTETTADVNETTNGSTETDDPLTTPPTPEDQLSYKATADFEINEAIVCVGDVCTFTPQEVNSEFIYVWNFGDGSFSSSNFGKHQFKRAGEFSVQLDVKHPKTNETIASATKGVVVHALPATDFTWEQASEAIPSIQFINLTDEAVKWNWEIKGLKTSSQNSLEYTFRKAGKYAVELTAVNEKGCKKSIQKTVTIENDYNLLAPKAFSPNADGENDHFIPVALKLMDVPFTMTIMDKSGKPVYTTQNVFEPWDGRYTQDNRLAPNGSSYIWRVILTNKQGEKEMYEGQVFVIR